MMTVHDLAAFVAVAECGSVRQAAAELARTQPAVSQAIQRIEDDIGFPLLDRSGYRAVITERGRLFLNRAKALVKHAGDLKSYADVLSRGHESRLRLSVHGSLASENWIPLIAHIPAAFPDTALEIRRCESGAPIRELNRDSADLAIAIGSPTDAHIIDIDRCPIGEIEFVNVVERSKLESESNLAQLPQILVTDFEDPGGEYGVADGHRFWRVSDFQTKLDAIVMGLGWGALPKWMVADKLADDRLQQFVYRGLGPISSHPIFLCRRQYTPLGPAGNSIWEAAQTQYQ